MKLVLFFCFLFITLNACEPPYCENRDCGTCGNACCKLLYKTTVNYEDLVKKIEIGARRGGWNGRYQLIYNNPNWTFPSTTTIGLTHTTLVNRYVDDMTLTIIKEGRNGYPYGDFPTLANCPPSPPGACLIAFSKSRIGICDQVSLVLIHSRDKTLTIS